MLKDIAKIVRGLSADAIEKANSGHPGMPIGSAEIGSVLYGEVLKHDPTDPQWPDRDRFVLSAGHASMLLYSLLHLSGYDISMDDIKNFRQLHSKTPGHPEYGETPGVETTTGPLGQGFANSIGMALAERMLAERFNTSEHTIVDHYTYALIGDGGMMEGISSEAGSLAGHLGLGKLITIYDCNKISIEGDTDITFTESVADRFRALEWHVIDDIDGHDISAIQEAIAEAKSVEDKPSLIIARTHIAYQAPSKQDSEESHGAPLGEDEVKGLKENIGLPVDKKFYVTDEVKEYFADKLKELKAERQKWEELFNKWAQDNPELKEKWDNAMELKLPADLEDSVMGLDLPTPKATRDHSGAALREIADKVPYLVGGSADLAPSNRTHIDKYADVQKGQYGGRNFRFGIREHAMGSISNGLYLHGGFRPYCATFLIFADYMRPAIRMAALMGLPIIYVLTHDSVYVGEDGPTHQPIEQTESLRIIPNLKVLRPADDEETKAAWLEAIERKDGPTALVLTRQGLPHLEKDNGLSGFEKGGYVVSAEEGNKIDVTLIASGSEVPLAVDVKKILKENGKDVRVVSIPDREAFVNQGQPYMDVVLGDPDALRVSMEIGISNGWYRLLGENNFAVSIERFGVSGPGKQVAEYLGFEAGKIAEDILDIL